MYVGWSDCFVCIKLECEFSLTSKASIIPRLKRLLELINSARMELSILHVLLCRH